MIRAITAALALVACASGLTFDQRRQAMIDFQANPRVLETAGYATIAAKLYNKQDPAWCSKRLQELLAAGPQGDMFWMYPVTAIAYLDKGQLTAPARKALRESWKTYAPYRGDTENHWLLYYTTLYLMSQMYPDEPGDTWFTGKSSQENFEESKRWIESWVKLTTTRGQGEYDSTHYIGVYMLPVSYLAEWAKDPAMKKRATMMLDYLIGDYAAENLNGLYAGAHARSYDHEVVERAATVSSDFGWLLFGLGHPINGNYAAFYSLARGYEPPEILKRIATDRSQPYTHYERKRTRNRWRFHDGRHGPVYKTTYIRKEYAVGSDQGGILQPIQEHSWDVTWAVPDARGIHNTLFALNPHSSLFELQTYFVFGPDFGMDAVVRSKKSYDSPDKLVGGSPYEKIFQDQDTIIALYDIAPGQRFPHVNGFFSKDLREVVEDKSGWVFARGGDARIAFRPLQPYSWKPIAGGGRRLFSPYLKNGVIVQVAPVSEFATAESFHSAIRDLKLEYKLEPTPSVRFRSLRGRDLSFTYGQAPAIDGNALDYSGWPLFGSPFLEAAVDSERLTLKHGRLRRALDFKTLTVSDSELP